jgi:hypothetical protein
MKKLLKYLKLWLVCLFFVIAFDLQVSAQTAKVEVFIQQYVSLKAEGEQLWAHVQKVNLSDEDKTYFLGKDIFNHRKRLQSFSNGVQSYNLDYYKKTRNWHPHQNKLYLIYTSARALVDFLNIASDFLSEKRGVYFKVALKYEEAWRLLDGTLLE